MKNCAFTIVAKNYVGLAEILEESIKIHYKDLDFYIFVADEVDDELKKHLPENVIIGRDSLGISSDDWADMSFKYNITEFCTSIKPSAFKYLIKNKNYSKLVYLDPDIYFYSTIEPIFNLLEEYSIVLTPHITKIETKYTGDSTRE